MKNEALKITYSYWDGQGHRRIAMVKKGDTVKDFLQKVKEQLIPEFRELRWVHCAAEPSSLLVDCLIAKMQLTLVNTQCSLISCRRQGWCIH